MASKRTWQLVVCALVLGLAAGIPAAVAENPAPPGVYPPDQNVFGMSYGDWSAAWWQYALAFTNDLNPILDPSGVNCSLGQSTGPVFFLVGAGNDPVVRNCIVPFGKALFFPVINVECSTVEPAPFHGDNAQEVRTCAGFWADGIGPRTLFVTADGKMLDNLKAYRVQSPFYEFITPLTNNFLGVPVTSGSSISDGYWVMLKPLSKGSHVIHFGGAILSGPGAGGSQNVTYYLTVVK